MPVKPQWNRSGFSSHPAALREDENCLAALLDDLAAALPSGRRRGKRRNLRNETASSQG